MCWKTRKHEEEASQDALRTAHWAQTQKEMYKMCKKEDSTT